LIEIKIFQWEFYFIDSLWFSSVRWLTSIKFRFPRSIRFFILFHKKKLKNCSVLLINLFERKRSTYYLSLYHLSSQWENQIIHRNISFPSLFHWFANWVVQEWWMDLVEALVLLINIKTMREICDLEQKIFKNERFPFLLSFEISNWMMWLKRLGRFHLPLIIACLRQLLV
jgi:hypothetical protein